MNDMEGENNASGHTNPHVVSAYMSDLSENENGFGAEDDKYDDERRTGLFQNNRHRIQRRHFSAFNSMNMRVKSFAES